MPEHEMTWEELKQKAKKMGYYVEKTERGEEMLCLCDFQFYPSGYIYIDYDRDCDSVYCLARCRTPEQMYQIMEALQ